MNLLTKPNQQAKMIKTGKGSNYLPYIMHLYPYKLPNTNKVTCAKASPSCIEACFGHVGRLRLSKAKLKRTELFFSDRKTFLSMLKAEITLEQIKVKREKAKMSLRLNGTSDIAWESIAPEIFDMFPDIQFYDYTKIASRFKKVLPKNYHLTFSLSENNKTEAMELLEMGHNVAVVFRRKAGHPYYLKQGMKGWIKGERIPFVEALPKNWNGYKVIDGDKSDLRFNDKKGVVVGLRSKGLKALNDTQGFVQD